MIDFSYASTLHKSVREITSDSVNERAARGSIENLEQRLDRQNMLIQTLMMLLLEKKVFQENEVREWLKYVDGLDGRVDGRLRQSTLPITCPVCSRVNSPTAIRCQYCGADFGHKVTDPRATPE